MVTVARLLAALSPLQFAELCSLLIPPAVCILFGIPPIHLIAHLEAASGAPQQVLCFAPSFSSPLSSDGLQHVCSPQPPTFSTLIWVPPATAVYVVSSAHNHGSATHPDPRRLRPSPLLAIKRQGTAFACHGISQYIGYYIAQQDGAGLPQLHSPEGGWPFNTWKQAFR